SGIPLRPALCHSVASKNTLPAPSLPLACTSNTIQIGLAASLWATYSFFSSCEKAMPLGRDISLVSSVTLPSVDSRYTPQKSCSRRGSSQFLGSPYGGSVKYKSPFDLKQPSLGLFSRLPS